MARLTKAEKLGHQRRVDTRRQYDRERQIKAHKADTPIAALRRLAKKIWRENTNRPDACPEIKAGRGMRHCGRLVSYCEGRHTIVFARHERNLLALIHEMVHALGPETHGRAFLVRFDALYWKYLR